MTCRPPLLRDTRGATIVEFALVAPILCLFLAGAFDVAHTLYMRSVLQGIVQKTGRDSTLESSTTATRQTEIDAAITAQVRELYNGITPSFSRRYFTTYAQAAAKVPEVWVDTNGNGRCDAQEVYVDSNGNGTWDADGGSAGVGGAKDRVVYTVTLNYPRMLPIHKFIGGSATTTVSATTVLQNQPYADQTTTSSTATGRCA